jgi:Fur family ferric uptake transcriptional regulator
MQREVDQFCQFLQKKELKLTPQRLRIAETVFGTHKHFTADQLYALVKKVEPLVGKVTVYRTLEQLVDSGMVEELSIKKGVATYEHVAGHSHHDHLICLNCGRIDELSSERLEKLKREEAEARSFEVISHSLKIYGLCPDCKNP